MTLRELPELIQSGWTILHETRSDDSGVYVLARCSCGTEREVLRSRIATGRSRSCGCQREAPEVRFWRFVAKSDPTSCWEWQSTRNRRGYGKFWLHGRTDLAHRVSYRIHKSEIPSGLVVRHSCDNPPCVNPMHLLLGTNKENARDALDRDRYKRGVDNKRAKLSDVQVQEVKQRWAAGGETQASIARRFNVSRSAIQWILNGRNWTHLGDDS